MKIQHKDTQDQKSKIFTVRAIWICTKKTVGQHLVEQVPVGYSKWAVFISWANASHWTERVDPCIRFQSSAVWGKNYDIKWITAACCWSATEGKRALEFDAEVAADYPVKKAQSVSFAPYSERFWPFRLSPNIAPCELAVSGCHGGWTDSISFLQSFQAEDRFFHTSSMV